MKHPCGTGERRACCFLEVPWLRNFCEIALLQGISKCVMAMCATGYHMWYTWCKITSVWEYAGDVRNLSTSCLQLSIYSCCSKWIAKVNTAHAGLFTACRQNKNCNSLWCTIIFHENIFRSTLKAKILYLNEIHSSVFYWLWETDSEKEDYQAETNSCVQRTQIYTSLHFK